MPYVELSDGSMIDLELEHCGRDWNSILKRIKNILNNTPVENKRGDIVVKNKKVFLNDLGKSILFNSYISNFNKTFGDFIRELYS
jgi:hypothetical protein